MLVISNNSPIRYLVLLDCIHLLPAIFSRVTIPAEVQAELQRPRREHSMILTSHWNRCL